MRLFIVRHGETAWNREGRFQGQLDVPLNEAGLLQADRVAERFRGYPLAAVLTSPLSRARVTGGRGVGLSIARAVTEAHGGTISVESESGVGSCFTVTLPAIEDQVGP